jgi:hypothetical protein
MSKADLSFRLLAIIRFTIASNSSRTLNATQAYDVTSSGITLASATGKLVDKDVAVKALAEARLVGVGLTVTTTAANAVANGELSGAEKVDASGLLLGSSATLNLARYQQLIIQTPNNIKSSDVKLDGSRDPAAYTATTLRFSGTDTTKPFSTAVPKNSKATNPNTVFYGGIPVGTGDYNKWQGKYAVLKINTITGNCVLRIYEA